MTVTVSIDGLPLAAVMTNSPQRAAVVPAGLLRLLLQGALWHVCGHGDLICVSFQLRIWAAVSFTPPM